MALGFLVKDGICVDPSLSRRFRLVNMDRVPKVLCVLVRMSDMRQMKRELVFVVNWQ